VLTGCAALLAVVITTALSAGCVPAPAKPEAIRVGHHGVRLVPPPGWEHLDHGREQLFRNREAELTISLSDLGPSSRAGLVRELEAARRLWLEGRRKDAFARVRELHGPTLAFAPSEVRAKFWGPWNEVVYLGDHADSSTVGHGFDALVEGTATLAPDSLEMMAAYAVMTTEDVPGREVARQERRVLHGATWVVVDTWSRVSHLDRRRIACLDDAGYLLALRMERGSVERAGLVFEALLGSIDAEPDTTLNLSEATR
jgi:hypothetical protein